MKTTFLFCAMAFAALTLGFSSCDTGEFESSDIVGSWKQTREAGWEKENGKIVDEWDDPVTDNRIIEFNNNGTGTDPDGASFTWKLSGETLNMNIDGVGAIKFTVEKLTSSEAVISTKGSMGKYETYNKMTYIRVE